MTDLDPGGVDTTAPSLPPPTTEERARAEPGKKAAKPGGAGRRTRRAIIEWTILIGSALVIAILIKTFLFQAFYIPSESMKPTLNVGDRVLVNKLSYKMHDVNRGDIVVFTTPPRAEDANSNIQDLVKRVIGLPGETVEFREGGVFVNGRPLEEPYVHRQPTQPLQKNVPTGCGAPSDGQPGCVVPSNEVYVMGDNRPASKDSRFFGPIKESSIVGRVFVRIWPLNDIGFP